MKLDDASESQAGALLDLVNEVADAVVEEHPDVLVGTLAYVYSRKAPKNVVPRPNVQIQLCSIESCLIHSLDDPTCDQNAAFCRDLREWGKIAENINVWYYVANFSNYNATYGTLAGVIVVLVWFWITNLALLFGIELDAEIERTKELKEGVPLAEKEIQLDARAEPKERHTH